jgi:hypothetical protein
MDLVNQQTQPIYRVETQLLGTSTAARLSRTAWTTTPAMMVTPVRLWKSNSYRNMTDDIKQGRRTLLVARIRPTKTHRAQVKAFTATSNGLV